MEKLKIFFTCNDKLFAINNNNKFLQLQNRLPIYATENHFPSLKSDDIIMIEKKWFIVFDTTDLNVYNIDQNFIISYSQKYDVGINLYDTTLINGFISLYLMNNSSIIISLETFKSYKFLEPRFIANTNGESIIELDIQEKNSIFYRDVNCQYKHTFDDFQLDSVTNKSKQIVIDKVINLRDLNHYIVQSNYDWIYKICIQNSIIQIGKIVIKNTFLGDTVCLNSDCYHITNQNIYKIDWQNNKTQLVLNWAEIIGNTDYSGIIILQVYNDIIVFLGTISGTLVFYSCELNKIIDYTILNRTFYINTRSVIFQNKLWLIDAQGLVQIHPMPI